MDVCSRLSAYIFREQKKHDMKKKRHYEAPAIAAEPIDIEPEIICISVITKQSKDQDSEPGPGTEEWVEYDLSGNPITD